MQRICACVMWKCSGRALDGGLRFRARLSNSAALRTTRGQVLDRTTWPKKNSFRPFKEAEAIAESALGPSPPDYLFALSASLTSCWSQFARPMTSGFGWGAEGAAAMPPKSTCPSREFCSPAMASSQIQVPKDSPVIAEGEAGCLPNVASIGKVSSLFNRFLPSAFVVRTQPPRCDRVLNSQPSRHPVNGGREVYADTVQNCTAAARPCF